MGLHGLDSASLEMANLSRGRDAKLWTPSQGGRQTAEALFHSAVFVL